MDHNTCFRAKAYLKSGCWMLFAAAIIFFISSNIVMRVCRNALKERLPEHVKEYLKNLRYGGRIISLSSFSENNFENNRDSPLQLNINQKISNINNSKSSNNTDLLEEDI